ncbi:MAG: ATP-binding protein [Candidatus Methylomirabilales bacterium]
MPAKHEAIWPGVETARYRLPSEAELIARVSWLISLRWVAAAAVILLTLIAKHLLSLTIPWVELCLIGAAILAYNSVFAWLLRSLRGDHGASIQTFSHFAACQILLDWLALTLVVHYTGGIESPALSYFIFNAIVASILLPARLAFLLASFGVLLVMGLALLEFWGVIPHLLIPEFHDPQSQGLPFLMAALGFFVSAILVSIYLATSITREMVRRTRELAELKQNLEDAYQKMRTLYETSRAVNSSLNLSQVLSTIVRQATEAMGVKASSIRLLDEERRFLEVSAAHGLSDAYLTKGKVDPQRGEMDRLTLQGKAMALLDATVDPRFQYPEEARKEGICSVLSVPLMLLDRAIGVLRVYTGEVRHFTKEETEFLMALASQGAAAIQNARAFRQLQELEEAKSRFVFAVTHELKAPVAALQSQFAVLQGGYAGTLTERQQVLIDRAARRMARLQELLRDLLALGALKDRLPQHKKTELNLVELVRRVAEIVQPEAEARGLAVGLDLPQTPLLFHTTEEDMHRLVGNLLENAVKYTPQGGKVSLEVRGDETQIKIVVADTGIGISPEAMPHIFEEFYRAANVKELGTEGTGLGLSLVKRIVDLYQGQVRVESKPGRGSVFTVTLPGETGPTSEGPVSAQKP